MNVWSCISASFCTISFTLLGMFISIMISNECALTFVDSMYIDLGFKEYIAAIPSMIHFATWANEEDTFDDFII